MLPVIQSHCAKVKSSQSEKERKGTLFLAPLQSEHGASLASKQKTDSGASSSPSQSPPTSFSPFNTPLAERERSGA